MKLRQTSNKQNVVEPAQLTASQARASTGQENRAAMDNASWVFQMQQKLGNRAVTQLLSTQKPHTPSSSQQQPIQRKIKSNIKHDIWGTEIAGRLVEENETISEAIQRLHSIRTDIYTDDYDSLVQDIKDEKYKYWIEQSRKESPNNAIYKPLDQKISHPIVPEKEQDPRVRINIMIGMFNSSLPDRRSPSPIDKGLYHEIQTAIKLVRDFRITHGSQISRGLTQAEKDQGRSGTEQMILTATGDQQYRELDFVFPNSSNGPTIVEAKNKKTADTHQVKKNLELARETKGSVMYSLPGEKKGQKDAIVAKYEENEIEELPVLEILQLDSDSFAELYFAGEVAGLARLPTLEALLDESFNPDNGGFHDSEY